MNRKTLIALTFALASVIALSGSAQTPATASKTQPSKPATSSGSADLNFINSAAMGGMVEVELGRLASEKAEHADVKQFGQRMVDDHGKANDELKQLAASKNITLPAELGASHKMVRDRLSKLNGAAFDRAYMRNMVQDHKKDVAAFDRESKMGKDVQVKNWASQKLPTLREHLTMATDINGKLTAGTSGKGAAKKPGPTTKKPGQ